ncbi:MAG: hypothetical protein LBC70_04430, partial [Chitinispirillales bacterium]|nr:hypothetical protein [Chitinispirillales bacterium]
MTTNIIFFFSSVAFFYVVAYLAFGMWFRGNRSTYMKIFLAMGLTISTWALFNGLLVLLSEELSQRMYPLFLPLTCIVPALMMLYSLHFTGSKFANSRTLTTVMSIMVTVNVLMILTNPWHHELYSGFDGPLPIAGRWFPVHALIAYSFLLTAYFVFFHFIIKNIRKTPSLLFVGFAMILPVIVNALFTFDILHLGFDITPFAFLIMFFVFSIYSINLRLFDNRRAAFFNLFSRLSDAFLVMDSAGRVTDANPSFKKIFSALELKFHKTT